MRPIKQWLNYEPSLLHRSRTKEIFECPEKIMIQRITGGKKPLKAAYDNHQIYNKESINNIILKEGSPYQTKYILSLINSRLINWFYTTQFTNESNLTVNLSKTYLSQIPVSPVLKSKSDTIVKLVDEIMNLKKQDPKADTSALENGIDQLVYKLYGLSEDEIQIVEQS